MLKSLTSSARSLASVLFPPTCWADGSPIESGGLSDNAMHDIAAHAAQNYCRRCGLTTGPHTRNDFAHPCGRCGQRNCGVKRFARVGTFSEPLVTLVHRLKFGRSWEVAGVVAPFLHHAIHRVAEEADIRVDALIPIPLHWTRRIKRGFNQSEELARHAAKLGNWPVRHILRRAKRTAEQARIESPTNRAANVHNAFVCLADKRLAGKHVWIIDDVSTTGTTIHAAATALRKLPAKSRPASINAAALCVTDHASPSPVMP